MQPFFSRYKAKKLIEAGKPVPKPSVELPPLVTPAGTSITLGPGPGQAIAPNPTPVTNVSMRSIEELNGQANASSSAGEVGADDDDVSDEVHEKMHTLSLQSHPSYFSPFFFLCSRLE
jgi:hypothetical protein